MNHPTDNLVNLNKKDAIKTHRLQNKRNKRKNPNEAAMNEFHNEDPPTRTMMCNTDSDASGNDSAESNSSLLQRLKARSRAHNAWIKSQQENAPTLDETR